MRNQILCGLISLVLLLLATPGFSQSTTEDEAAKVEGDQNPSTLITLFDAIRQDDTTLFDEVLPTIEDLDAADERGSTALVLAAYYNRLYMLDKLLYAAADPNVGGAMGSPIHGASYKGYTEIIKHLVYHGASLDVADSQGSTPLHYAVLGSNCELVEFLLARGARYDIGDNSNMTAKEYADKLENPCVICLFTPCTEESDE
jgi:ankyrin repeat protein